MAQGSCTGEMLPSSLLLMGSGVCADEAMEETAAATPAANEPCSTRRRLNERSAFDKTGALNDGIKTSLSWLL